MIAAAGAAHTDRKAPHWLAAGAVAVLAVTAADYALDRRVDPAEPQARLAPAELRAGIGPRTFAEALADTIRVALLMKWRTSS